MTAERLHQLARAWRRHLLTRDMLFVAAAVLLVAGVAMRWLQPAHLLPLSLAFFVIAVLLRLRSSRVGALQLAHHLDRTYPQLEESSALWLRQSDSLTTIERLQRGRIDAAAQRLSGEFAPTITSLRIPFLLFLGALVLFGWSMTHQPEPARQKARLEPAAVDSATVPDAPPVWPKITGAEMLIVPPAYTGRGERRISGMSAEVEEGATVTWSLTLDQPVENPRLIFGPNAPEPLTFTDDGTLRGTRAIAETALYQLSAVRDGATWNPAEIHSLKVVKDRAPALQVLQPGAARTEIAATDARAVIEVLASDDYGVNGAHLVATVAKGTGEVVKFREQRIAFDSVEPVAGELHLLRFGKTLDLLALGLEPGDELYFYVAATDNRQPSSNQARSETRFIVLQGPEQSASTPGVGVSGIDLVPQYFRSQRQIIIDTEKLIAERATLPAAEFQQRSNDLGVDQQLLRQRYAQFLGEEVEEDAPPEEHLEGDGHDHGPPSDGPPRTHAEVAAEFGHQHDSQDAATLFDRETKGTMRQVLAAMWEAERHLRVGAAEEALAPENRALEILKELQQADREYVKRVGFEATPLDVAGRRGRGDVSEVPERRVSEVATPRVDEATQATRELLRQSPWGRTLDPAEVEALRQMEPALMRAATEEPEKFLPGLQEVRQAIEGGALPAEAESKLKPALLRLLPPAHARPVVRAEDSPSLAEPYFRHLESTR
ncbi:DUF4175 family protein [soil metagenome]